jgi:hypothetical protein
MKSLFLVLCIALLPFTAKAEKDMTYYTVSGPIMVIHSDAYWGLNFSGFYGVTEDFDLGGQTGFFIHSANSVTSWVIPVVPTGIYHFHLADNPNFTPFVGLGLGIGINHASVDVAGTKVSDTDVDFMGLVHLGANMGETQRFFGDIQLGLLSDSFVFVPSVGWRF